MGWEKVISIEELKKKGHKLFHLRSKQVLVLWQNEKPFALDNRCPHEGYPLSEGSIDQNCILTCNWHNWKFDLASGKCILGGDDVRVYHTKIEDGAVFLDSTGPSKEEILTKTLEALAKCFTGSKYGQLTRELTRLHFNDIDLLPVVNKVIDWSHKKFKHGTTHAYAATADWLALYKENADQEEKKLIPIVELFDHIAQDCMRLPDYTFSEGLEAFTSDKFATAIENEDETSAIKQVNWGLSEGYHFEDFEKAFVAASLAHYNDFGHSLIYTYKAKQLIAYLGESSESHIIKNLVRSFCYTTREDLIPEFKKYAMFLSNCEINHPKVEDYLDYKLLLDLSVNEVMAWVADKSKIHSSMTLYKVLMKANAYAMIYFNTSLMFSTNPNDEAGWLDFTHALTFGNASRYFCETYPAFWSQALLQLACFLGRNRDYCDYTQDCQSWMVADTENFLAEMKEKLFDHGMASPIHAAHFLKTTRAIIEESVVLDKEGQRFMCAALNRYINTPGKAKHVLRRIRSAINLIAKDFK